MKSNQIFELPHGKLESAFAKNYSEQGHILNAINRLTAFQHDSEKINALFYYLDDFTPSIGMVGSVLVDRSARGKGVGSNLMDQYMKEISSHTDIDILFARTDGPQRDGFSLEAFYQGYGFKAVHKSCGELLMVTKGHEEAIMEYMDLNPNNSYDDYCAEDRNMEQTNSI